ncbi:MAG: hypothetical protein DRN27_08675 [Thermoplasmata archaeon]|nr:MAG: hypothetical protein DRN27_08675 [Thermoplasmata archaeon]
MKKIIALLLVITLTNILTVTAQMENSNQNSDLQPIFSWRNIDGVDYTTSVKDQRPVPTCEAYALVAAIETLIQYQVGYPFDCDLSETHLFFYPGGTADWGVNVTDAANYLIDHGVPDEGCFPDPHRPYDFPFESLDGWEERTVKITEWGWVENNVEDIKQALVEYGPLTICMLTRNDFFSYRSGIYTPRGQVQSGHVITITGYNDITRCWEIKNTGGEDWGEDGYIRVSYDADTPEHPFFWPFYGGTGIMYIDGIYGNFMPDVPKIQIKTPELHHTYLFGLKLPTILKNLPIQAAAPRIIGRMTVKVQASNTQRVEFYCDGELMLTDDQEPYEWQLDTNFGLHTIETYAYNQYNISKDIVDIFVMF